MAEDLVLDGAIRDWVLIPLSVVMVLIGVLRYFVSKLMRSSQLPDAKILKEGSFFFPPILIPKSLHLCIRSNLSVCLLILSRVYLSFQTSDYSREEPPSGCQFHPRKVLPRSQGLLQQRGISISILIMFGFDLMLYVLECMRFRLKDLSFVIDVSMMGVFWLEIKCWVLILMEFITHVVWKDRSFTWCA